MKRKIVKLSEVAIRTTVKCEPEISDSVRWVGADHLDEGDFTVKRWSTTDDPLFPPTFKFAVKSGSVLIHSRNPKKIATLNFDAITGEKFFCLLPKTPALLHPSFLAYQLQSGHFFEYVMNRFTGSVNKFLNWSALADYEFELPSIEEQHRIVEVMTAVDEHIESLRHQLDVLQTTRKSVLHHLLNAGGEGWTQTTLGQVCRLVKGISYKSSELVGDGEGIPFINLKSIDRGGGFRSDGLKWFQGKPKEGQIVRTGDLVLCCTDLTKEKAILGFPLLVPEVPGIDELCISLDMAKLLVDSEKSSNGFMFLVLQGNQMREFMIAHSSGTTVLHLQTRAIGEARFSLPPLNEQQHIVDEVSKIDGLIKETNSALASTQQLRSALLNKEIS